MDEDLGTPRTDPGQPRPEFGPSEEGAGSPPTASAPAGSPWTALVRVLAEPGAVFAQLKERPARLPPVLAYALVQVGVALLLLPAARAAALEALRAQPDVPAEAVELGLSMLAYTAPLGAVIGLLVTFLLVPLVLLLLRTLMGGEGRYGQLFSVYAYAYLPLAIGALLTGLLAWFSPGRPLEAQTISPAMFLPAEQATTALHAFLARLSPFAIWSWMLVMIGFATVTELPRTKVFWTLGILWLAWAALMSYATPLAAGLGGVA